MIGYYVHHHGSGHRARYDAIAPMLDDVVAISELEIDGGLRLPSDVPDGVAVDPCAGGGLHWAPLHAGASRRLQVVAEWLASNQPAGVVVDVSVEATVTCRLAGVPTLVIRQLGRRDDRAHELAYRIADRLVAPWPAELDDDAVPAWIRDKTDHVGYVRPPDAGPCARSIGVGSPLDVRATDVVVLWGRGGGRLSTCAINAIAANCAGIVWCVGTDIVEGDPARLAPNVSLVGWRTDIDPILRDSPTTVTSAGNNVIADAARWRCPLVLVPQDRPFDEQRVHAARLASLGAAVVVDDADCTASWPGHLDAARSCADRLGELYRPGGAERLAAAVSDAFRVRVTS